MSLNELQLLSRLKDRPELYLGRRSLIGLRDFLNGVRIGANAFREEIGEAAPVVPNYDAFIEAYSADLWRREGRNGYVCWWNHMLYVAGGDDALAFDTFFHCFEAWLRDERGSSLTAPDHKSAPDVDDNGCI